MMSESKMAVSESNMAEFKMAAIITVESESMSEVSFVQNGWIHDGRVQDVSHHLVKWEWISLSQIKLVWVKVSC